MVSKLMQILLFTIATNLSSAQPKTEKATQNFLVADSVVIVSHLYEYRIEGRQIQVNNDLVLNNHPNYKIIKQRYKLNKIETDSLYYLLTRPNNATKFSLASCFEPHHGILIFRNNRCFFIDLCFGCLRMIASKEIPVFEYPTYKTWKKLELFFRNRNLNYGMPENDDD